MSSLGLDDMVHGKRRGPLPLRWVYLHVLGELAQHCGNADILREQLISQYRAEGLFGGAVARRRSGGFARGHGCRCDLAAGELSNRLDAPRLES